MGKTVSRLEKLNRQWRRLKNCGNLRGVLRKLSGRRRERLAKKRFGVQSFPDAARAEAERAAVFPRMVKFSILVPLWNNPPSFQIQMLDSVMNQTYQNWELCLADGSDEAHGYVEEICREYVLKSDGRIRYRKLEHNAGIAGNTNACLSLATGEYIGLLDQDDLLHPSALYEYAKAINESGADYLYCDETTFRDSVEHLLILHLKPDYAPDNLRANNYICHFSVFRRPPAGEGELFRSDFDGSQDHDLILRLTERAENVVHIPKVLYYWRKHSGSVASGIEEKPYAVEAAKRAVAAALERNGFSGFAIESTRAFETIFRIRYRLVGKPKISIVIPSGTDVPKLRGCVDSVRKLSSYDNYEIILADRGAASEELRDFYAELTGGDGCGEELRRSRDNKITLVAYRKPSGGVAASETDYALLNYAAGHAAGEYLLFLGSGIRVITREWLEELLMYAQRTDVGAVGAKIYRTDDTVCHAGMIIGGGADKTAQAAFFGLHRKSLGYMGGLCYAGNVSAVAGGCLMVRKAIWEAADGFDEAYRTMLGEVDFCLRLRQRRLLNVFTPFAELYLQDGGTGRRGRHRRTEAGLRRTEAVNGDVLRFRERWAELTDRGDPYYNPNFSTDRSDYTVKITRQGIVKMFGLDRNSSDHYPQ